MENPTKMDDLGVPLFLEAPILGGFPYFSPPLSGEVPTGDERYKYALRIGSIHCLPQVSSGRRETPTLKYWGETKTHHFAMKNGATLVGWVIFRG